MKPKEQFTPGCLATLLCLLLTGCDDPARLLDKQLICTLEGKAYIVDHRMLAVAALNRNQWADDLCKQIPRKVQP